MSTAWQAVSEDNTVRLWEVFHQHEFLYIVHGTFALHDSNTCVYATVLAHFVGIAAFSGPNLFCGESGVNPPCEHEMVLGICCVPFEQVACKWRHPRLRQEHLF